MTSSKSTILTNAALIGAVGLGYFLKKKLDEKKKSVLITVPDWLEEYENSLKDKEFKTDEEMMEVAVELSARNVANNTGGPFGCAIYERDTKTGICKLFSCGVNRVVTLNNSTLHGEMVAIQLAQKKLASFTMTQKESGKEYVMHTSCEPCAMCLGGTFWSGVSEMVCSATKDDAESIGFNEGPVFEESYKMLESIGMKVKRKVLREKGAAVLKRYGETGLIYNGAE